MEEKTSAYEQTYKLYLKELGQLDLPSLADALGVKAKDDGLLIPLFGDEHFVCSKGIVNSSGIRPSLAYSVILGKYCIMCPKIPPTENDWVSFKDFADAAPFVGAFRNNAELRIAKGFSGKLADLEKAADKIGGAPAPLALPYQFVKRFSPLPKVPVLLLFNDADDEFSADAKILFERRVDKYLDMECLAMIGWHLADELIGKISFPAGKIP